jgi:putative copper resistance protein D
VRLMEAGPTLLLAFAATAYGHSGSAALGLLLVLALWHGVMHWRRRSGVYSAIAALLLLLIAAARVRLGHAYEHGALSLAAAVELTHLLAMALWVGSVFVAAWVTLPHFHTGASNRIDGRYLHALSQWATVALAGVLLSGLYNAYRVLNAPAELLQTQYGWVLTAKLCFVALAVALGGWNRFVGFPAVLANQRSDGNRAGITPILAVLRVESIALLIVLLAAAVLTGNAPPSTT